MSAFKFILFMTALCMSSVTSADRFTTTYHEKPAPKVALWTVENMSVNAYVNCHQGEIYSFWPAITCNIRVNKPRSNKSSWEYERDLYSSLGSDYKLEWQGVVKGFVNDYWNKRYDMVKYLYDPSISDSGEAMFITRSGSYTLNGFNGYIKEEVEKKSSIIRNKVLINQAFVVLAIIVGFISLIFVSKILRNFISKVVRRVPLFFAKSRKAVNKANVGWRNKKLRDAAVNETVLLSVRDAYNNMDSEETAALRKEIAKAIANNDPELADKLGNVLANIKDKKVRPS